ncbi:MAG: hypothetical protein ACOWWR_09245 [Eubacteriales bacterium]
MKHTVDELKEDRFRDDAKVYGETVVKRKKACEHNRVDDFSKYAEGMHMF